jgi:CubicO group peptidase (beta-lactamase class C family)
MQPEERGACAGVATGRNRWLVRGAVVLLALPVIIAYRGGFRRSLHAAVEFARHSTARGGRARTEWVAADPAQEGLSRAVLDSLRTVLADKGTAAFLVVRANHVVYEWYGPKSGPDVPYMTTAMAKAVTGTIALLTAVTDGRLSLDDPASKYIPAWRSDSVRSKIRIRDLASHQSGLDDVDFSLAGEHRLEPWKETYWEHPDARFHMAIADAPILYPPGTRFSYSGVGFYALAYALTTSLQGAPQQDVRTLLRDRIMKPVGIPDDDWRLSYGASYQIDGMTLYAMGSGARYTARAVARMGELMLDHGHWGTRQLLDSAVIAAALQPASGRLDGDSAGNVQAPVAAGGGWWLNLRGTWPAVPRDAFAGLGAEHEAILVVPSLDLVMVRLGKALSPDPNKFSSSFRDELFDPLMHAVIGSSSRMRPLAKR